jgi:hypothetical protein
MMGSPIYLFIYLLTYLLRPFCCVLKNVCVCVCVCMCPACPVCRRAERHHSFKWYLTSFRYSSERTSTPWRMDGWMDGWMSDDKWSRNSFFSVGFQLTLAIIMVVKFQWLFYYLPYLRFGSKVPCPRLTSLFYFILFYFLVNIKI